MSKKEAKRPVQPELPEMPEGSVPKDVREIAEDVIRMERDIAHMREDLNKEKEKLLDKMVRLDIPVAIVVIDKWKSRIRTKPGKLGLKVEDAGMVDAPKEKKA